MSKDDIAIEVKGVSKYFLLPHQKSSTIKSFIVNPFARYNNEKQHALQDVSFEVKKGEFFGIVGRNGSGKSTLLKCMAGVYSPDKGHINVNGSLVPFIELGVGFNPELSGRDNVYLNGALLGFSRSEIDAMYDEIVEFAELENFMDQKLKNYSSGMQVRLAFSIAIRANGDILLLDEVLAVGDTAFQQKCNKYFSKLKKEKKTIVLVTHDMSAVQRFCSKALLIDNGELIEVGKPQQIADKYESLNRPRDVQKKKPNISEKKSTDDSYNENNFICNVRTIGGDRKSKRIFYPEDNIVIEALITPQKDITDAFIGITLQKSSGELVYWLTTERDEYKIKAFHKGQSLRLYLTIQNIFSEDTYAVNLLIKSNDRSSEYFSQKEVAVFDVYGGSGKYGWMLRPDFQLDIKKQ